MNKTEIKEEQTIYMDLYEKLKSMKFSGMAEELRLQLENPNSDLESFQEQHLMKNSMIRIDNWIYQQ